MGLRTDQESGRSVPVTETYPSYFKMMMEAFENYPVAKYFGLTIQDAMSLPVNQWYSIRDTARRLAASVKSDNNEAQLLQLIKQLMDNQATPD